jgi:hypothetical protein
MNDYEQPCVEYYSSPYFTLPIPATRPELIAAQMITEGRRKAADFGLHFGELLTTVLYFAREPEARARRIADAGDRVAEIAEVMVQAGRAAAQTIPEHLPHSEHADDMSRALHKLEISPCPVCGRAFGQDLNDLNDGA